MRRYGLNIETASLKEQRPLTAFAKRVKTQWIRIIIFVFIPYLFLIPGCEHTTFQSSVPTYPVRFSINTNMGEFVHFKPTSQNEYVTLTEDGYSYNGKWVQARLVTDAYGYAGTVVFVSINGYDAYDLACPYCAARGKKQACEIDGIFAVCPHCGEQYDLGSGTAAPQKGIAKELLRRYAIINSDGKLTITQQ